MMTVLQKFRAAQAKIQREIEFAAERHRCTEVEMDFVFEPILKTFEHFTIFPSIYPRGLPEQGHIPYGELFHVERWGIQTICPGPSIHLHVGVGCNSHGHAFLWKMSHGGAHGAAEWATAERIIEHLIQHAAKHCQPNL